MTKENISNNLYSSTSFSTSSVPLRWMPRFMCKSSPLICRPATPTFSVASITKVHTFGKLKQQHSNSSNMDKAGGLNSSSCDGSIKPHQTRQRHQHHESKGDGPLDYECTDSILTKLPMELIQGILARLDCMTLYQVCLTSSAFRHLLQKTTMIWHTLLVDSNLPFSYQQGTLELYKLVCFMVSNGIHVHVDALILDGCSFLDPALLDRLIRAYPNLTRLSLVNCPQIGCWQILYMLRASIKGNYQLAMLIKQQQTTQERQQQRQLSSTGNFTDNEPTILLTALKPTKNSQHSKTTSAFSKIDFSGTTQSSSSSSSSTETSTTRSLSTRGHILGLTGHHHHTQRTDTSANNSVHHAPLPCLKHLTHLNMEGAFPSERSYKSHTHEMYCFGEIKKALLQLGDNQDNENMAPIYQQLSEAHYALYQFWLLLRSHMLRWDGDGVRQDIYEQQQDHLQGGGDNDTPTDVQYQQPALSPSPPPPPRWQDFRPPWLPDTLVQFIQITEEDQPSSSVKIDLAPCPLCHRNVVAPPSSQFPQPSCYACHSPTPMVCAQCRCHSCHAVLCLRCHHTHQVRFRHSSSSHHHHPQTPASSSTTSASHPTSWISPTATPPSTITTAMSTATAVSTTTSTTTEDETAEMALSSWRTLHCQQCHLPRRVCGQASCVNKLENNKQHRWTCTSCQQQQKRTRQRKVPPRFFKKARHWSHWI